MSKVKIGLIENKFVIRADILVVARSEHTRCENKTPILRAEHLPQGGLKRNSAGIHVAQPKRRTRQFLPGTL